MRIRTVKDSSIIKTYATRGFDICARRFENKLVVSVCMSVQDEAKGIAESLDTFFKGKFDIVIINHPRSAQTATKILKKYAVTNNIPYVESEEVFKASVMDTAELTVLLTALELL